MSYAHKSSPEGKAACHVMEMGLLSFRQCRIMRVHKRGCSMSGCISVNAGAVNLNTFLFCFLYYLS